MKTTLLVLIAFFYFSSRGQEIPRFEPDSLSSKFHHDIIIKNFNGKYDEIISYTISCYWPMEQGYVTLIRESNKWKAIRWKVKYLDRTHSGKRNIKRITKKRIRIKNSAVDSLLGFWKQHDFLNISNDSLNVRLKETPDSITGLIKVDFFMMTDGCSYQFEVITNFGSKFIYAYNPEEMMKRRPNPHNELFIRSTNRFHDLILK